MRLYYEYGLPFTEIELFNGEKGIKLSNVLIDTGSATTIISTGAAIGLGLGPQPDDKINHVRGVGGVEAVYEKKTGIMVEPRAYQRQEDMGFALMFSFYNIDRSYALDGNHQTILP